MDETKKSIETRVKKLEKQVFGRNPTVGISTEYGLIEVNLSETIEMIIRRLKALEKAQIK